MPSSPPSPKFVATPLRRWTVRGVPPLRETRLIRPVARSETSASPSGRNATPHGTLRPVATTLGIADRGGGGGWEREDGECGHEGQRRDVVRAYVG